LANHSADGESRGNWIRTNRGIGTVLVGIVVLLLIYLSTEDWVYQTLRDGFRLGFFSVFAAFTMLACAIVLLFDGQKDEVIEDVARAGKWEFIVPVIVVAVCFGYFKVAWEIDFLLVTPVMMAIGTYALGVRPITTAIIAGVIMTITIYGLFWAIGIELPTNLFSF